MKIGYPCINRSIGCQGNSTFRLKSYSRERLLETVRANLDCLQKILEFNVNNRLLFFRITSDLVPFASHPVMSVNWQEEFRNEFKSIGNYIHKQAIRISMHPGQYTLLNSPSAKVLSNSIAELHYHADVLELLGLDSTARIQLHVGGVYGDKAQSLQRFIRNYARLDERIRRFLVIENDERFYGFDDCLTISSESGVPVLLDVFHEGLYDPGFDLKKKLKQQQAIWSDHDGLPMLDFSTQKAGGRFGAHSDDLDREKFRQFLQASRPYNFDLMLEIKNKETAALAAVHLAADDSRFIGDD